MLNTTVLGAEFDSLSSVKLVGGGTITFADSEVRTIGSGWSGGYAGQVLHAAYGSHVSVLMAVAGLAALAFEVEPEDFSAWNITFALSDRSSTTLPVVGDSGAQFFGFALLGLPALRCRPGRADQALPQRAQTPSTSTVMRSGLKPARAAAASRACATA